MIRRVSGLVAMLAVARFSLGGAIPSCTADGDSAASHAGHAVAVPTHIVDGQDAGAGGHGRACDHPAATDCVAMSACAMVLAERSPMVRLDAAPAQGAPQARFDAPVLPTRTPDPPPPRA